MDDLFKPEEKKRGINKLLIVGVVAALAVIGVAVYLLSFKPPMDQQTAKILDGVFREGSPEFAEVNKDIIIWTDDKTVESPTGLGTISMYINGNIKNKGTRTFTAVEVNVGVITRTNAVLREKRVLVVPIQQSVLAPGDTIVYPAGRKGFRYNHGKTIAPCVNFAYP